MRLTTSTYLKLVGSKPPRSSSMKSMPPLPEVSQLVKLYQVKATKFLSQNFLYEPKIIDKFVSTMKHGSLSGQYVCEVGPGPGSISRSIIERDVEQLMVVEKDHRFMNMLKYLASICEDRLHIVHGDILRFNLLQAFPSEHAKPWDADIPPCIICGNLPFNISLPLLFNFLNDISLKQNVFTLGRIPLVFTFQHEVGERLIAEPGDPQRCRISVTSQFFCDNEYHFQISGGSFVPTAKVDVAVMRLEPKKKFIVDLPFKTIDFVVKHAMHNRKKNCAQGIKSLFPPSRKDLLEEIFRLSSVNPSTPGYKLDNLHFRDLCYAYETIATRIPQLRLVDTYSPKHWLKYFDADGNPLEET